MTPSIQPVFDAGTGPQDLVLVRRALRGDSDAIELVLQRLSCIVRFVFRLNRTQGHCLPTEALEDVTQQVYASMWPRLQDYAGASALESWAFGFCRNCLRAEFRRRCNRLRSVRSVGDPELLDADALAAAGASMEPARELSRNEGLEALRDELDRLEPKERLIVELRHLENWSFERIATHLDLPASTVKDRCYRALLRMKDRLRRRDVSA